MTISMLSIFISMAIFAFIGAVTPGPVNIIATSAGASLGFRQTFPYVMGATISYTLIVILMTSGLSSLFLLIPEIAIIMQFLGAGFLLYMAYKIASSPVTEHEFTAKPPPSVSFMHGSLIQSLNPKAWLVSMSGASLFVSVNSPALLYSMAFCIISFFACLTGVSIWAASGQYISRFLSGYKQQTGFNIVMGLLLSASVIFMFI